MPPDVIAPFIRPRPPIMTCLESEVRHSKLFLPSANSDSAVAGAFQLPWLFPSEEHDVMWDPTMSAETTGVATLREAMCRAFRSPLVPAQQQQILAALEEDSKSVFQCGLTPQRLPELVDNNPVIAAEALLKLMVCTRRGCQASKYLART